MGSAQTRTATTRRKPKFPPHKNATILYRTVSPSVSKKSPFGSISGGPSLCSKSALSVVGPGHARTRTAGSGGNPRIHRLCPIRPIFPPRKPVERLKSLGVPRTPCISQRSPCGADGRQAQLYTIISAARLRVRPYRSSSIYRGRARRLRVRRA